MRVLFDFFINIARWAWAPLESSVYVAKDDSGWAAAANFILSNEPAKLPLDLSILADCSGSMGGSRINWMKQALKKLNSNLWNPGSCQAL